MDFDEIGRDEVLMPFFFNKAVYGHPPEKKMGRRSKKTTTQKHQNLSATCLAHFRYKPWSLKI